MRKIYDVKVNHLKDPFGIDYHKLPVFEWKYKQADGLRQLSYRIYVSQDPDVPWGDVWDSGVVYSANNFGIVFRGRALTPCTVYYFRIEAETSAGRAKSGVFSFETGIANEEWDDYWITAPLNFSGCAIYARRDFIVADKEILRARAYVLGMGYHELYLNGDKYAHGVLTPAPSDYNKRFFYRTYDITASVRKGEMNCVCAHLGKGWYGMPALDMIVKVFFADGTVRELHSYDTIRWWIKRSPIKDNSIYGGETYDARMETPLASVPEYMKTSGRSLYEDGWTFALYKKREKDVVIEPQPIQDNAVVKTFSPISRRNTAGGVLYEFERIFTGWARIWVRGARGAKVILRFVEALDENGDPLTLNLRSADCTDTYILKGEGEEEYAPRFTFRGFRYVTVTTEGEAELLGIRGEYVKTAVGQAGEFTCSCDKLNRLHANIVYTEGSNQMGILSDCPQRDERFGWLNDLTCRLYQNVNNFDMSAFLPKVLQDIVDMQRSDGAIGDTAPYYIGGYPADPSCVSFLLIPKFCYERYGDSSVLQSCYEPCKKWVNYLLGMREDGVLKFCKYGDWCPPYNGLPPDGRKFGGMPEGMPSTLFLYWYLDLMVWFATLLQKNEDIALYEKLRNEIYETINARFYSAETGGYGSNTQTENAMCLSLGLVPENRRLRVYENIKADIVSKGYHQSGGNQAYRHILRVLADSGDNELVYKILTNPTYPGWGYMLEKGAVSVWERWEYDIKDRDMQSYCHPMFGSYDEWFYRELLGIKAIDGVRGMREFVLSPAPIRELHFAKGYLSTVNGNIFSSWKREGGAIRYNFVVPSNTKAILKLQGADERELPAGKYEFVVQ